MLMGFTTYHQIVTELSPDRWAYEGMQTYVLTHKDISDKGDHFLEETPEVLLERLKGQEGRISGFARGADIVNQMVKEI
ncbi:MAG: hypothetical protein ACLRMZ_21320 [Blautia marasmi]